MKKIISFLPIIIVGIIIFLILKRADLFDVPITYKNVTHHGITLDVPDNFTESYNTSNGDRMYYNKSKSLEITIEASDPVDITIKEYIDLMRQVLLTGSANTGYATVSLKSDKLSSMLILDDGIEIIDGNQKGRLFMKYNQKVNEGTRSITEMLYFMKKNDKIIQVNIVFETDKKEDLQDIIDHVSESIRLN